MHIIKLRKSLALTVVLLSFSSIASASIVIDGTSLGVSIPGTTADATITAYSTFLGNDPGSPSLFNNEVLSYPGTSDPNVVAGNSIQMSNVPIFTIDNNTFLRLIYDSQETSPKKQIDIASIAITVGGQLIWAYDSGSNGPIIVNPDGTGGTTATTNLTIKPLGQGADLALFIPMTIFDGMGLLGSDNFVLSASQVNSDNGNDEWAFQGFAADAGTYSYFDPTDMITSGIAVVPVPAAVWLFGSGLLGLVGMARRKKAS